MASRKYKDGDRIRCPESFIGEIVKYDSTSRRYAVRMIYLYYSGFFFKVPNSDKYILEFTANTLGIFEKRNYPFSLEVPEELVREDIKGLWVEANNDSIVGRAHSISLCPTRMGLSSSSPIMFYTLILLDKGVSYLRTAKGAEEFRFVNPFEHIEPENKEELELYRSRLPFVYATDSRLSKEEACTDKIKWYEEYGKFAVNGTFI